MPLRWPDRLTGNHPQVFSSSVHVETRKQIRTNYRRLNPASCVCCAFPALTKISALNKNSSFGHWFSLNVTRLERTASPAWWDQTSAEDRGRLESFLGNCGDFCCFRHRSGHLGQWRRRRTSACYAEWWHLTPMCSVSFSRPLPKGHNYNLRPISHRPTFLLPPRMTVTLLQEYCLNICENADRVSANAQTYVFTSVKIAQNVQIFRQYCR